MQLVSYILSPYSAYILSKFSRHVHLQTLKYFASKCNINLEGLCMVPKLEDFCMKINVVIIGQNKIGLALYKIIQHSDSMVVVGFVEANETPTSVNKQLQELFKVNVDVVIETTGDEEIFKQLRTVPNREWVIIPVSVASIIWNLFEEKQRLITELSDQSKKQDLILDSTHDGMIAIDVNEDITLFNKSAEKMTGINQHQVIGKNVLKYIPSSMLPHIIRTGQTEVNKEQILENGTKIITTRIPLINENGEISGALAVFKDVSDIVGLAEEVTNLKSIQTMLEAIINSSEEAISVVDEDGKGIIINPAYSRLTGLKADQVIGKPATTDISEGESMHMRVLKTRKPVRGARMRVGPHRRDVVVNVAPVIVDGMLKGSVGVIQDMSEIQALTDELQRARQIIRTLEAKYSFDDIVGESEEIKFAIEQARLGAITPATVLLRGESGTGKELFAHAIHNESKRKFNKFVRVNCAALTHSLLESELFGYEEGAFSGASKGGKRGLFEEADGGSIFLDEIGEISSSTQAKLLRVLQEHEIIRVGGTKPIPINVRIIAATNVNLERKIIEGGFREDLYYRINRLPIHIPPLRERKEDLEILSLRLLQKLNQDYGRNIEGVKEEAIKYLQEYNWPGNVRELENVLGRAIIHMGFHEHVIDIDSIPPFQDKITSAFTSRQQATVLTTDVGKSLNDQLDDFEKRVIKDTLEVNNGNKTKTAKSLGISLRNLYYKLEKYNLAKTDMQ
jgi:PAS domain S-box-containing protein